MQSHLKAKLYVCDAKTSTWIPKIIGAVDFIENPVCIPHICSLLSFYKHTILIFFAFCFPITLSMLSDCFLYILLLFNLTSF